MTLRIYIFVFIREQLYHQKNIKFPFSELCYKNNKMTAKARLAQSFYHTATRFFSFKQSTQLKAEHYDISRGNLHESFDTFYLLFLACFDNNFTLCPLYSHERI